MKPIIAITTRTLNNEQKDRYITQETYCKALDTHGASYISVTPNKENDYTHIVSMCDGLLVSGGGDIDASYYNEENHEKADLINTTLDAMDMALIDAFDETDSARLSELLGSAYVEFTEAEKTALGKVPAVIISREWFIFAKNIIYLSKL